MTLGAILATVLGVPLPAAAGGESRGAGRRECAAAASEGAQLRESGKFLQARAAFSSCAREGCPRALAALCAERLRSLDAVIPTVIALGRDDHGAEVPLSTVSLDGQRLPPSQDGRAVPVDPGEHTLRFEAPGFPPVDRIVFLRSGEKDHQVSVVLRRAPAKPLEAPHVDAPAPARPEPPPPSQASSGGGAARGVVSLSLLVAAIAAGSVGEYFVIQSSHEGTVAASLRAPLAPDACADGSSATCRALSAAVNAEHDDLLIGRVLLGGGVGLVLVAAATWLFWPAPSHVARVDRAAPGARAPWASAWIAPSPVTGGGALFLGGAF